MSKKRIIYAILTIMIGLLINAKYCFAAPTVEELLQKVADNTNLIEDIQLTRENTWRVPDSSWAQTTINNYWYKAPDKQRTEVLSREDNMTIMQTHLQLGTTDYLIDPKGIIYNQDTAKVAEEENLPGHMDFINNIDDFLVHYDVSINIAESDEVENIYCLDVLPKQDDTENELFSKLQIYIDYEKGVWVKEKVYDLDDILKMTVEAEEYEYINNVWYAQKEVSTTTSSDGTVIIHEIANENIVINEGINDSLFELILE